MDSYSYKRCAVKFVYTDDACIFFAFNDLVPFFSHVMTKNNEKYSRQIRWSSRWSIIPGWMAVVFFAKVVRRVDAIGGRCGGGCRDDVVADSSHPKRLRD